MDGMTESEPTLSSACCGGYRPIGHFRVIGRIWKRKFNVPISKPDAARPALNWLQLAAAAPTNRAIPVKSFIYRAPERLEPGLSPPGVQRSTN